MEIEGLGWLAGGGDRRVWDRWEMGSFDERERERERERDYTFWLFYYYYYYYYYYF